MNLPVLQTMAPSRAFDNGFLFRLRVLGVCVCVCGLPSRVVYLIVWLKLDTTLPLYLRRKKSIRVTTYDTHLFQMLLEYHI